MSVDWQAIDRTNCSVAGAIDVIGDRASLLVLRDAFTGTRRYADFRRNTGLARNILADRLHRLVGDGILERRQYQERPPRSEYRLTRKGLDLWGILIALMQWGDAYGPGVHGPLVELEHKACGAIVQPQLTCPECGDALGPKDVRALPGSGARLKKTA